MRVLVLSLALALGVGCATHVPPNQLAEKRYLEIQWRPDFAAGRADAAALDKPLLVMLVSGQLDGLC